MQEEKKYMSPFQIVFAGHVDHGKSTLIGRLLYETDSLPEGKKAELEAQALKRGMAIEWSFLTDALQIERDQGITLDASRVWFKTKARSYTIIDAPGHEMLLRNMVSGASFAEGGVLVVDSSMGVAGQTARHAQLLAMLGLPRLLVAVNKMDLVGYDEAHFKKLSAQIEKLLKSVGLKAEAIIPVSARSGDNIVKISDNMPWWRGKSLAEAFDALPRTEEAKNLPLRFPVQDVYRLNETTRLIAGRLAGGTLSVGEEIIFSPGEIKAKAVQFITTPSRPGALPKQQAEAGESVAVVLDKELVITRGMTASSLQARPQSANRIAVAAFWLNTEPLKVGQRLELWIGTATHFVTVEKISGVKDPSKEESEALFPAAFSGGKEGREFLTEIQPGCVGNLILSSLNPIIFDPHTENRKTGRAVLVTEGRPAGGCLIQNAAEVADFRNLTRVPDTITEKEIAKVQGHYGAVIWLTGLSGAGKSTIAGALHKALFMAGWRSVVVDGDNLRSGLSADLDFSPEARAENIRRAAEVAKLMAGAGLIVIASFITPLETDRARAAAIIGQNFREIYVKASLEICEKRDPKNLYARARAGSIKGFTGVGAPYDPPRTPDLELNTEELSVSASVDKLVALIEKDFVYR